jgi:hypothetical protein
MSQSSAIAAAAALIPPPSRSATPLNVTFQFAPSFILSACQQIWWNEIAHIALCLLGNPEFRATTLHPLYNALFIEQCTAQPTAAVLDPQIIAELNERIITVDVLISNPHNFMEISVPHSAYFKNAHVQSFKMHINPAWIAAIEHVFSSTVTDINTQKRQLQICLGVIKLIHEIVHTLTPHMATIEFEARKAMFPPNASKQQIGYKSVVTNYFSHRHSFSLPFLIMLTVGL